MERRAAGAVPQQAAKPRGHTQEYKRQVGDLVVGTGRTATFVAAEPGVHHTPLSRRVKRYGRPV